MSSSGSELRACNLPPDLLDSTQAAAQGSPLGERSPRLFGVPEDAWTESQHPGRPSPAQEQAANEPWTLEKWSQYAHMLESRVAQLREVAYWAKRVAAPPGANDWQAEMAALREALDILEGTSDE